MYEIILNKDCNLNTCKRLRTINKRGCIFNKIGDL